MTIDVTLVIPTRGERLAYFGRALDSVTSQVGVNVQVVVVASELSLGLRQACSDDRVTLLRQSSRGISAAINQGWRASGVTASYWAWLGDDDLLAPSSLKRTVAELSRHPDATLAYGDCVYMDEHGRTKFVLRPSRWAGAVAGYGPNFIPQPGSLLRADAVRTVGLLDESLRYAMDLDLFLRLRRTGPSRYVPRVLAAFRWHHDSTTVGNQSASSKEARAVRAAAQPAFPVLNREWGVFASAAGWLLKRRGQEVDTRSWNVAGISARADNGGL